MQNADPRRWKILGVLCACVLVTVLDGSIVNTALPVLAGTLSATVSQLQWIVDSYLIVFSGTLLTAGTLGDRFGRKGALLGGLLVFGVASLLAGLCTTSSQLIAARSLMGLGAAFILPTTLSIITQVFPASERPTAIALWSAVTAVGVILGPVTGGLLLVSFHWGSIFLINLPIVVCALVATLVLVPGSKDPAAPPVDVPGNVLAMGALVSLLYGVIEAPLQGWSSAVTLGALALAFVQFAAFAAWELRARHPMLDLSYFRDARFSAASGAITLLSFALFGTLFVLTQNLQLVLAFSPLKAGACALPFAFALMMVAPQTPKLVTAFGPRLVVAGGLGLIGVGLVVGSRASMETGYPLLVTATMIMGAGMGAAMAPATESIMSALPPEKAGVGSAINDATREVGGAIGVAVLGSTLTTLYVKQMGPVLESLPAESALEARESLAGALQVASRMAESEGEQLTRAARAAFLEAFDGSLLIASALAFTGMFVALVFLPGRAPVASVPATAGE
jgi:EmrB/QacA subfamily drug resistance transporter